MEKKKYHIICGQVIDLMYDEKIKKLNFELAKDKNGAPIIILQDWTKVNASKDLVKLHIKEAVEIKAVIDNIIIDYYEELVCKDSVFNDDRGKITKRK